MEGEDAAGADGHDPPQAVEELEWHRRGATAAGVAAAEVDVARVIDGQGGGGRGAPRRLLPAEAFARPPEGGSGAGRLHLSRTRRRRKAVVS